MNIRLGVTRAVTQQAGQGGPMCLECGGTIAALSKPAQFCCANCRKSWGNRRMTRGAELYDLFMAHRYAREEAAAAHVMTLMNRLAAEYRADDKLRRAGRRSWQTIRNVLAAHPSLRAIRLHGRRTS